MQTKKIDFAKYSSIRIGPVVDVAIIQDNHYDESRTLIGGANNLLISNNPPKLMMLSKKFDYIKIEGKSLVMGGATPTGKIVSFCKKHNIAHFEYVSRLPGTLGGMVKMNAGLKEFETFKYLQSVTCKDGKVIPKSRISYGYRYSNISSVIFEARFAIEKGFSHEKLALFAAMRHNQPKEFSAGSCFKNPLGDYAGRLIEAVGLKGTFLGEVGFSPLHANFLVNRGGGEFKDALALIHEAKERVKEKFDILLEEEIIILNTKEQNV